MADTVTPSSDNPYLALLQQEQGPPTLAQILQHIGNLGFGLAGGFSQAATTGRPTMAGIGPGLMMGNQMNAQAAQQAEQERMKRLDLQFKAQEHEDKRAEVLRKQKAIEDLAKIGFQVTPQQGPLFGPNASAQPSSAQPPPDLKTAGAPLANYLVAQHGLSPLAASTIVGNLYQESSFNPSATGDSGSAFGLAQWRLDRQTGLRNFAATQNKPVTDPQVQLDYLVSEMKGGDMGAQRAYAMLQQATTPEQANTAIMHFFRPQGYTPANPTGGHGYGQRVANTRALLPQGRPVDPATAPVPGVTPDPDEAPVAAPGPAPRPGLGPRATPPGPDGPQVPVTQGGSPFDPNAQPPPFVAQGGGEGEVVLPRIGLPFPAQARAPAPPGSVPFPTASTVPSGPVQPNYTPTQPGMVPQTPGGGPAPGGVDAPPQRPVTPNPGPDPAFAAQQKAMLVGGLVTPDQYVTNLRQNAKDRYDQLDKAGDAQHAVDLEVYKQKQESRRHERGLAEQKAAEQRKLETDLVPARDRTTNEIKWVSKAEAAAGVKTGQLIPLEAGAEARAEAAAALAKENAARAAANQDVIFNPATGQWEPNATAIQAKKDISAAQGTDPSSKITLELAQDAIKRNSDWQKAGAAAGSTIRNIGIFNKLSEDVKTGKFVGSTIDLKAALKGAGINLEAWGIPDNLGTAQAMQMMSQRFALEMRQEMPGPMSDGDRSFMERGALSIEKDPGANQIMAAWLKGNAERAQDRAKFAREYIRSGDFKSDPAGIDDYVEQKLAGKDYFDHSVLPKVEPTAQSPIDAELKRRGKMNSAKPP